MTKRFCKWLAAKKFFQKICCSFHVKKFLQITCCRKVYSITDKFMPKSSCKCFVVKKSFLSVSCYNVTLYFFKPTLYFFIGLFFEINALSVPRLKNSIMTKPVSKTSIMTEKNCHDRLRVSHPCVMIEEIIFTVCHYRGKNTGFLTISVIHRD